MISNQITTITYNILRIVESVEKLAGKVDVPVNETFVAKTKTVSVAVYKPPAPDNSSGSSEREPLGDITAFFIEFGEMKNLFFMKYFIISLL